MSRVTRREWYRRVNNAWPDSVPALTGEEALRAVRRLFRYGTGRNITYKLVLASGNRRTWFARGGVFRVNPSKGWHDLVHVMSHIVESSGHNGDHARCELRMIKQVIKRGWLKGKLRTPEHVPLPSEQAKRMLALMKIESKRQLLKKWHSKKKRAETAIRKLTRSIKSAERRLQT